MPFINIKTNVSISKESEKQIKSKLGECIKLIGKTENWLMINIEENQKMQELKQSKDLWALTGKRVLPCSPVSCL